MQTDNSTERPRRERGREARPRLDREAPHARQLPRGDRGAPRRARGRDPAELRALPDPPEGPADRCARDALARRRASRSARSSSARSTRRYSASPDEAFFTGGGQHRFANFDRADDGRIVTLRDAFRSSINLPFVRLMRDLVDHLISRTPGGGRSALENRSDPRRETYLSRFAEREARIFLAPLLRALPRAHARAASRGSSRGSARRRSASRSCCARRTRGQPRRVRRGDGAAPRRAAPRRARRSRRSTRRTGPIASASRTAATSRASTRSSSGSSPTSRRTRTRRSRRRSRRARAERIEVYRWLFRSRHKSAQDRRIRTELEREAFADIHAQWRRTGYPFDSLVPSYATAIGSSADRPSALAELAGILLNDGVRQPTHRIERLAFAEGTPYETRLAPVRASRAARDPERGRGRGARRAARRRGGGTARRAAGSIRGRGRPAARDRRQDRHRRPPLQDVRAGRTTPRLARREPHRDLRLHDRRPLLRGGDRPRDGPGRRALRLHELAARADVPGARARGGTPLLGEEALPRNGTARRIARLRVTPRFFLPIVQERIVRRGQPGLSISDRRAPGALDSSNSHSPSPPCSSRS